MTGNAREMQGKCKGNAREMQGNARKQARDDPHCGVREEPRRVALLFLSFARAHVAEKGARQWCEEALQPTCSYKVRLQKIGQVLNQSQGMLPSFSKHPQIAHVHTLAFPKAPLAGHSSKWPLVCTGPWCRRQLLPSAIGEEQLGS